MAKTQLTQPNQRFSHKRVLGTLLAFTVVFLLLTSVVSIAGKYFTIKRHIQELTIEQEELAKKHAALAKTNAYLATPEGQEQALRDKYGVIRPGEGVIVVSAGTQTVPPDHKSAVGQWWSKILAGLGIGK